MIDFLRSMYDVRADDRAIFGDKWCGPDSFEYGKSVLLARYPARRGGDGQPAEVWGSAMPARFYEVRVQAGPDSMKEMQPAWPFVLSTGSGREMGALCVKIAEAIAEGMIGFSTSPSANHLSPKGV